MIDATPAGETANSYIDVATADAIALQCGLTSWAGLTNDAKEAALVRATMDIDTHHFHHPTPHNAIMLTGLPAMPFTVIPVLLAWQTNWDIDPTYVRAKQTLKFPRRKDLGVIPRPVQNTCLVQAEFIAVTGEYDRKQWQGVKDGAPKGVAGIGSPLCPRAYSYLRPFIKTGGMYSG